MQVVLTYLPWSRPNEVDEFNGLARGNWFGPVANDAKETYKMVDENQADSNDPVDIDTIPIEQLKAMNGSVLEITQDKTYTGPKLKPGGWILVGKANIYLMTPFLAIDTGRERIQEWMLNRIYGVRFKPGQPVIFDGCYSEHGHGATFDPFWEPHPGKKNEHLNLDVRYREKDSKQFVIDEEATAKLKARRDEFVRLLWDAQGTTMPIMQGPIFRATASDTNLLHLDYDIPAIMEYSFRVSTWVDKTRKQYQAVLDDDGADNADRVEAIQMLSRICPIVLTDDDDWNTTFHTATARGWDAFWRGLCNADIGVDTEHRKDEMDALDQVDEREDPYLDIDHIVSALLQQIIRAKDGEIWVPFELLSSTRLITNVYVRKTAPTVYRLDHPDLDTYNRIAREPNLKTMLQRIEDQWNAQVEKLMAADDITAGEAVARLGESSGKPLEKRRANAIRARRHAAVLICYTAVLQLQLWFTRGRNPMITGLKASLARKGLKSKYSTTTSPQGVNHDELFALPGQHRGGLDV